MTFYNGYYAVYQPNHPYTMSNGMVYEHRIVAEQQLDRYLTKEESVHHKDLDKLNNEPDNLMVFKTNADHANFHAGGEAIQIGQVYITKVKNPNLYICPICGNKKSYGGKLCDKCYKITRRKVIRPNKEELLKLICNYSFVDIGKMYQVSDNAIRRWCKFYNLPTKKQEIKNNMGEYA